MPDGSALLDIGANIGLYSLYAASMGHEVLAVEPHPLTFAGLVRNCGMNAEMNVKPLWCAVADPELGRLRTFNAEDVRCGSTGGSCGARMQQGHSWGVLVASIYELAHLLTACRKLYVKIDIDHKEDAAVESMIELLRRGMVSSCLVEVTAANNDYIRTIFDLYGYDDGDPLNWAAEHSRERRKREGIDAENIIFRLARGVS